MAMKLLAFDTSTEACSVAVQVNGEVLSDHRIVQREHAALLLPMLSQLLAEFGVAAKDIDGVVYGQGPGSFTGLRIAAAAAQGLALAADCGVHGVSTLHAMASGCARLRKAELSDKDKPADRYIMCAIDARMDQIYANTYRVEKVTEAEKVTDTTEKITSAENSIIAMAKEAVVDPERYVWPEALTQGELLLCGSGAERYQSVLQDALKTKTQLDFDVMPDVFPHAIDLLRLTDTANPSIWKQAAEAQPVYLRNKVALTEAERSSA